MLLSREAFPKEEEKLDKHLNEFPYTVDPSLHRRFDERQTIFARRFWDRKASFYGKEYREDMGEIIAEGRPGYSRLDFARILAAWTVHDCFSGAFSWRRLGEADPSMIKLGAHPVTDPALMSKQVKETACMFGADIVGICKLNHKWIYSYDRSGDPIEIPDEYRYVIVMGIAMDKEAVMTSPVFMSAVATGVGYSRMAFTIASLAQFIRNLRYGAIPMGNDTALSIPLAIDAGLGQLGRNGLLITLEYGPCVRLCKVFTDLPLKPDRPIDFGITKTCKDCNKCATACEANAISFEGELSYEVACPSNNEGILRWAVNADRCYEFWVKNGAACSNCIAACPYINRSAR
jgi:hypothetical protein